MMFNTSMMEYGGGSILMIVWFLFLIGLFWGLLILVWLLVIKFLRELKHKN